MKKKLVAAVALNGILLFTGIPFGTPTAVVVLVLWMASGVRNGI